MTIIKKFQPIDFDYCTIDEDCGLREEICWGIADMTDPLTIQFEDADALLGDDVILNGNFLAGTAIGVSWFNVGVDNNWSDATNEACVSANSNYLRQAQTIRECDCFKFVFDLTVLLDSGCTLYFYVYDGANYVELGSWTDCDAEDDIEIYWCADKDYTHIAFLLSGTCDGDKCIDNVRMFPFDPTIKIKTCDGSTVATVDSCDIHLYSTHWNVVIDSWLDYISDIGCYKICIEDAQLIINGDFEDRFFGWTQEEALSYESWQWHDLSKYAYVEFDTADTRSRNLTQYVDLKANCQYTMTLEFNSYITIGESATGTAYLYDDNGNLIDSWASTQFNGLTKTVVFTPVHDIESIYFYVECDTITGGTWGVTLDDVSIITDICSKCVCVNIHDCTLLLSGTQDDDAQDFYYDDNFTFWLRISAELLNSSPTFDDDIVRKSTGSFNQLYGDVFTSKDLTVYLQPIHVWDAIYRMIIHDKFRINGVEYVKKEGDPEIDFEDNFGSGVIEVMKKNQKARN